MGRDRPNVAGMPVGLAFYCNGPLPRWRNSADRDRGTPRSPSNKCHDRRPPFTRHVRKFYSRLSVPHPDSAACECACPSSARVTFEAGSVERADVNVVTFYNGRVQTSSRSKVGRNAVKRTKPSSRTSNDVQTRLQLFALANNVGNFLQRLALPRPVRH